MKSEPQWLSTNFDLVSLRGVPVKVMDGAGREIIGHLEIENEHENGQIKVSANYDSSRMVGTVVWAKFYLTQAQLDEFQNKGAMCILIPPFKF